MATIKEDYVSFETAKLLKEKGFVAHTEHHMWYVVEDFSTGCHWNSCTYKVGDITSEYDKKCCIAMPTLQMAMKWLREVHSLYIWIGHTANKGLSWYYEIHGISDGKVKHIGGIQCGSYEVACESAIKYCLENLI